MPDRTGSRGRERRGSEAVDLDGAPCRVNLVVHHEQRAPSAGLGGPRNARGVDQIAWTVGGDLIPGAHRGSERNRLLALDQEVAEERRLLDRVGTAGHDRPLELVAGEPLVQRLGDAQHHCRGHVPPAHAVDLDHLELSQLRELGDSGQEILGRDGGTHRSGFGIRK